LADAKRRRFDVVRVTAPDRFSTEGIEAVFRHLATLDQCNVRFWSYHEPLLNMAGPMRDLYRAIIAWAAAYRN
jgi:hypothetical protein